MYPGLQTTEHRLHDESPLVKMLRPTEDLCYAIKGALRPAPLRGFDIQVVNQERRPWNAP
jgi:hypothetical protein